jgi:hypothetical protein
MLNKDICKRCINKDAESYKSYDLSWMKDDEEWWNIREVFCPTGTDAKMAIRFEKAIEKCPYVLEHVINEYTKT